MTWDELEKKYGAYDFGTVRFDETSTSQIYIGDENGDFTEPVLELILRKIETCNAVEDSDAILNNERSTK